MLSESVNRVLEAENQAAARVDEAREKARKLIETAQKEASDAYDRAIVAAMAKQTQIGEESEERVAFAAEDAKKKSITEYNRLVEETAPKHDAAVAAVIKTLLGE